MMDPRQLQAFSQRPFPGFRGPAQEQAPIFVKPKKHPLATTGPIGLTSQQARRLASATYFNLSRQQNSAGE